METSPRENRCGDVPASVANLVNLSDTDLGYNMLSASDPGVIAFLDEVDPDWAETQTVPPGDVRVAGGSVVESLGGVHLAWTPIPYTGGGYYQVSYATTPGGPYTVAGATADKSATGYEVQDLAVGASYYFVVRSRTPPHGDQSNALWSATSPEVMVGIRGVETVTIRPDGGELAAETAAGTVSLSFPAGAVSEPVVMSLRPAVGPPAPNGLALVGGAFSVEARTATGAPVTSFSQPFTLTLEYDEAGLAEGVDEVSLALHLWDEGAREWIGVASELDVEANSLVASWDQAATFAVLGPIKADTRVHLPTILKED